MHRVNRHHGRVLLNFFRERIRHSGKPPHAHLHRQSPRSHPLARLSAGAYDPPFAIFPMTTPARGSLLGIEHLETKEILRLLQLARRMNPQKARPLLRGKRIVLLFYEASTRTRTSFEFAAKALGATTTLVLSSGSSIEKGESIIDTGNTL